MIARRADTRARADFATWKMMAKRMGASSLPAEAQAFLVSYRELLKAMTEPQASDATINLIYRSYYAEMGGVGEAPDVKAQNRSVRSRTTSPPSSVHHPRDPKKPPVRTPNPGFPSHWIFACLVVVYTGFRYFWP